MPPPSSTVQPGNKDADREEERERPTRRDRPRAASETRQKDRDRSAAKPESKKRSNKHNQRDGSSKGAGDASGKQKRRTSRKRSQSTTKPARHYNTPGNGPGELNERVQSLPPGQKRARSAPAISHAEDTEKKITSSSQQQIFCKDYKKKDEPSRPISVHVLKCLFGQPDSGSNGVYECLLILQVYVDYNNKYSQLVIEIEYEPEDINRQPVTVHEFGPELFVAKSATEEVTRTRSTSVGLEVPSQVNFNLAVEVAKASTLQIEHVASIKGSKHMEGKQGHLKFTAEPAPQAGLSIPHTFRLWGKFQYKEHKGLKLRVSVTPTQYKSFRRLETLETGVGRWLTVEMRKGDVKKKYDVSRILLPQT